MNIVVATRDRNLRATTIETGCNRQIHGGGLRRPTPFLAAAAVAAFLAAASPLVAQTLDRAEIAGTIQDETGAALGGVSVTLRQTQTGFERTMVTGDDGRYSAPLMPLGVYVVRAERPGFSAATSDPLTLTVGQALVVNVVMRVAGLTETVSISAPGDTAPALGTVFDADAVSSLPIDGRDYRDFALLSPTAQSIDRNTGHVPSRRSTG